MARSMMRKVVKVIMPVVEVVKVTDTKPCVMTAGVTE
jgi:hypothetical protein